MAEVKLEQIELLEQSVKYKITSSLPILNIDYVVTSGMNVMTKVLMIPEGITEYTHNIVTDIIPNTNYTITYRITLNAKDAAGKNVVVTLTDTFKTKNVATILGLLENWSISDSLFVFIDNPENLGLSLTLRYKTSEMITRNKDQVVLDEDGKYIIKLTSEESNLILKLIRNAKDSEPKLDLILRSYRNTAIPIHEDVRSFNVMTSSIYWLKIDGVWKKARVYGKTDRVWKQSKMWYKNTNGVWNK